MPAVFDHAICLKQADWSETSQTVLLFCRDHGLVRGLAKGAHRPKAPFSGGIESLTRGEAGLIFKRTSDLAQITEWNLVAVYPALRTNLRSHHAALYIADILRHALIDRDPHAALFERIAVILARLGQGETPAPEVLAAQWAVLNEAGYAPAIEGEGAVPVTLLFSPEHGSLAREKPSPEIKTWRVSGATIELLRKVRSQMEGAAPTEELRITGDVKVIEKANRFLAAYLRFVLGREPPTLPMMFGTDLPA